MNEWCLKLRSNWFYFVMSWWSVMWCHFTNGNCLMVEFYHHFVLIFVMAVISNDFVITNPKCHNEFEINLPPALKDVPSWVAPCCPAALSILTDWHQPNRIRQKVEQPNESQIVKADVSPCMALSREWSSDEAPIEFSAGNSICALFLPWRAAGGTATVTTATSTVGTSAARTAPSPTASTGTRGRGTTTRSRRLSWRWDRRLTGPLVSDAIAYLPGKKEGLFSLHYPRECVLSQYCFTLLGYAWKCIFATHPRNICTCSEEKWRQRVKEVL